jgi:putative aldouronate transport system permease protein
MREKDNVKMEISPDLSMQRAPRAKGKWFTPRSIPLYLMILPALVLTFLFKYVTMPFNFLMPFMDWRTSGFNGWAGLKHFAAMFQLHYFWQAFANQWIFILLQYLFIFPAPIVMALLLNELRLKAFKKTVQTVTVLPHFVNWVVIGGIFVTNLLSPKYGFLNDILRFLGLKPVYFMSLPRLFPWLFTFLRIWKGVGYSCIIYLATLASIDTEQYEAAVVDGAGRLRQTWHVTLPGIRPTVVALLVMSFASVMGGLFEPILVLKNTMIDSTAEVLDTYIYAVGVVQGKYGIGAAAGLFKQVIDIVLLLTVNWLSRHLTEDKRSIL